MNILPNQAHKAIETICLWRNTLISVDNPGIIPDTIEALRYLVVAKVCDTTYPPVLKKDENLDVASKNKEEGWRRIGNVDVWFESKWHANYARFLDRFADYFSIIKWEYKPKRFRMSGYGVYEPTFRVTYKNGNILWVEVDCHDEDIDLKFFGFECYFPDEEIIPAEISSFQEKQEYFKDAIFKWEG